MSNAQARSEEEIGRKWDRCLSNLLIKSGAGFGVEALFSLLVFSRRPWPIAFATGLGAGMAFSNCQHDFKRTNERVVVERVETGDSGVRGVSGDERKASGSTEEAENNQCSFH